MQKNGSFLDYTKDVTMEILYLLSHISVNNSTEIDEMSLCLMSFQIEEVKDKVTIVVSSQNTSCSMYTTHDINLPFKGIQELFKSYCNR